MPATPKPYGWLEGVAAETRAFRERRAHHHGVRASRLEHWAKTALDADGATRTAWEQTAEWHRSRADGQRNRFERVARCGEDVIVVHCGVCRDLHEVPDRCCVPRVCFACRRRRIEVDRARFVRGRAAALRRSRHRRRRGRSFVGGRWGERFLTLTVPHSGDVSADARELARASNEFARRVRSYLVEDVWKAEGLGTKRAAQLARLWSYVRVMEVTQSDDGHAHLHWWMLGPFIARPVLAELWARSLSASYRNRLPWRSVATQLEEVNPRFRVRAARAFLTRRNGVLPDRTRVPVVDVRKADGDVSKELVKYLLKDASWQTDGTLAYEEPAAWARLYEALEGRRTLVASRGFHVERPAMECPSCGETGTRAGRRKAAFDETVMATGPCPPKPSRAPPKNASCGHLRPSPYTVDLRNADPRGQLPLCLDST